MTDTKALEDKANDLEAACQVFSGRNELADCRIYTGRMFKPTESGEIAVEFTHFPFYNGMQWTDSVMYAALLLRKMIRTGNNPLLEGRQLDGSFTKGKSLRNELYQLIYTVG